ERRQAANQKPRYGARVIAEHGLPAGTIDLNTRGVFGCNVRFGVRRERDCAHVRAPGKASVGLPTGSSSSKMLSAPALKLDISPLRIAHTSAQTAVAPKSSPLPQISKYTNFINLSPSVCSFLFRREYLECFCIRNVCLQPKACIFKSQ